MSTETEHYGLSTTPVETDKMFLEWRQEIDGETDSNMTKIDEILFSKADSSFIAEDYDNEHAYSEGEYAIFDGVLKKYNGTEWIIASIGADLSEASIKSSDAVAYTAQTGKTDTQKQVARDNIAAAGRTEVEPLINQWDEQWEIGGIDAATGINMASSTVFRGVSYIPVIPGANYYLNAPAGNNTYFRCYDAHKAYLGYNHGDINSVSGSRLIAIPSDTFFIRICHDGTTYNHDISINYPATYTGYYPAGLSKVEADRINNDTMLAMDGYISPVINGIGNYRSVNEYHKRIGRIDLGTLSYTYYAQTKVFMSTYADIKPTSDTLLTPNIIASGYVPKGYSYIVEHITEDKLIGLNNLANNVLRIRDLSYTDAAAFKAAMQGVYLYYELAAEDVRDIDGFEIIGGRSNRNLLDNPWFTVNQRNFSSWDNTYGTMSVDRWILSYSSEGVTASFANGVMTFQSKTGTGDGYIVQKFENPGDFVGKQYTLSVLMDDWSVKSGTITRTSGIQWAYDDGSLRIGFESGGTFAVAAVGTYVAKIRAAKLELGSVSTLANDFPPNYAEELAKCQRYFVRLEASGTASYFGLGMPTGATSTTHSLIVPISIPVTMRMKPTVTVSDPIVVLTGPSSKVLTDATVTVGAWTKSNIIPLTITHSEISSSNVYLLWKNSGYIDISADL